MTRFSNTDALKSHLLSQGVGAGTIAKLMMDIERRRHLVLTPGKLYTRPHRVSDEIEFKERPVGSYVGECRGNYLVFNGWRLGEPLQRVIVERLT